MKNFALIFSLVLTVATSVVLTACDSDSGTDANAGTNTASSNKSNKDSDDSDFSSGFECNMFRASSCDFTAEDKSWKFDIGETGYCSNVTTGKKDTLLYAMTYEIKAEGATVTRDIVQIGFIGESNCNNRAQGVVYEDHADTLDVVRSCDGMHYIAKEIRPVDFSKPGSTLDSLYKAAKAFCEEMTSGEF